MGVPSLVSLPRVNMNERHRACHSPKTVRERSRLKGIIHSPRVPGRGPPLTARSNVEYKVKRAEEHRYDDVPEMMTMLEAQDDTLDELEKAPVDKTRLPRGTYVPDPEPDTSIDPEKVSKDETLEAIFEAMAEEDFLQAGLEVFDFSQF